LLLSPYSYSRTISESLHAAGCGAGLGRPTARVAEDAVLGALSDVEPRQVVRIRRKLGLTPTETQLALHLADGGTVASFAEIRGASPGTVRMQLKSIFAKIGVNRQSEVAVLVRQLRGYGRHEPRVQPFRQSSRMRRDRKWSASLLSGLAEPLSRPGQEAFALFPETERR
jgi:DNA-binding CsgD family transcriptional regulator